MSGHVFESLPVDYDSIRLLLLHPSPSSESRIRCTLTNTKISGKCSYEALSYAWGEPHRTRLIFIDGRPFEVRDNLYSALRRLRLNSQPRILWVDAICIDQAALTEKGHQVKLMPEIYKSAQRILVWLGEVDDGGEEFLAYIKGWIADVRKTKPDWGPLNDHYQHPSAMVEARELLLQRTYWNRTWIIPEILLAKEVVFHCGASQIKEQLFRNVMLLPLGRTPAHIGAMILFDRSIIVQSTEANKQNIMTLLESYWDTDCADERDKVFAMLGVLPEDDELRCLEINYHVATARLYLDVIETKLFRSSEAISMGKNCEVLRRALRLDWGTIIAAMTSQGTCVTSQIFGSRDFELIVYCSLHTMRSSSLQTDRRGLTSFSMGDCTVGYTNKPPKYWETKSQVQINDLACFDSADVAILQNGHCICLLFREGPFNTMKYVGLAIKHVRDQSCLTPDLEQLHIFLLKSTEAFVIASKKWRPADRHRSNKRQLMHVFMPQLFAAMLRSYTRLRERYEGGYVW